MAIRKPKHLDECSAEELTVLSHEAIYRGDDAEALRIGTELRRRREPHPKLNYRGNWNLAFDPDDYMGDDITRGGPY